MSDENDDLLDPAEIEALLNEAGAGDAPTPPPPQATAPGAEASANAPDTPEAESDQLSQDDLDRLMAEATSGTAPLESKPKPPAEAAPPQDNDGDLLDPSEIEQLLKAQEPGAAASPTAAATSAPASNLSAETDELLRQAEAGLAAAISTDGGAQGNPGPFGNPEPYTFQEFGKSTSSADNVALNTLHDVELDIRIELGRTELLIEEVLQLRDGSVVPLDKLAGDPVDVIVNERLIARGEVLVLNDNFCVRITEILPPHL
ncbi:flagellar motor switch protein FliN [Symmachiella dynata]|uniref:Flagellar motor switch protein FliN n=1 Tax=Symmachiella dynata TaxID=2527995 RepID=A0A517ZGQ0_9PLAN|nr:flagellar motor switch protein FliN [Symmachiella dynata]QDT46083.1 Flagellar motor switch protein FliN [Symmachiella dynata]QDU41650.1 Flagellar motor switch protein FliN [Symmachiella dynata]